MKAIQPDKVSLFQRFRYSVFPGAQRVDPEKQSYRRFFNSLLLHFRPRTVPERTLNFNLSWGLGGTAFVLIFMLFGTGLLLKFAYLPFADKAYASILILQNDFLFGQLIRNIHHWSANFLLIIVFLHFLRVFFTGAILPPRQFNWVIGLGLFMVVMASNITGYLLPWDQLAFWAITICTGMLEYIPGAGGWLQDLIRGGPEVGPATLSNFYAIHTAILPALLLLLMPFHFWRVRKAGGLVVPRATHESPGTRGESTPTIPNLLLRELVVAMVVIAFVLVVSLFFNAPLEGKANPGLSPNPTKAPWYFAGFQEMLLHFDPLFALFVLPVIMLALLTLLPYFDYQLDSAGVWFTSQKGRRMALVAASTAAIMTPFGILVDEFFLDFTAWLPGIPGAISNGLIPAVIVLAGIVVFYFIMQRSYSPTNNETIQTVFILVLFIFIVFTVTCVWFRGEGMKLMWPWDISN